MEKTTTVAHIQELPEEEVDGSAKNTPTARKVVAGRVSKAIVPVLDAKPGTAPHIHYSHTYIRLDTISVVFRHRRRRR